MRKSPLYSVCVAPRIFTWSPVVKPCAVAVAVAVVLARVSAETPVAQGLVEMSRKGLGMTVVVDDAGRAIGVYTDGDLRRSLDRRIDVHAALMRDVMTHPCRSIGPRELAAEAVHRMETHRITSLPVVDADGRLVGALNVHDLLRAGVV